jgi:hypothetical protein
MSETVPYCAETVGKSSSHQGAIKRWRKRPRGHAKLTGDPLVVRGPGNTARGRRIRDLYRAKLASMGDPGEPVLQAAVLRWAELTTMTEQVRAAALASPGDAAVLEQLTRLERVTLCAERSLGPPAAARAFSPAAWLAGRKDPAE